MLTYPPNCSSEPNICSVFCILVRCLIYSMYRLSGRLSATTKKLGRTRGIPKTQLGFSLDQHFKLLRILVLQGRRPLYTNSKCQSISYSEEKKKEFYDVMDERAIKPITCIKRLKCFKRQIIISFVRPLPPSLKLQIERRVYKKFVRFFIEIEKHII